MSRNIKGFTLGLAAVLIAGSAHAIPVLQIYIDGATYDTNTETWVVTESEFDLWVIGDVQSKGTIFDVKLVASFFGLSGTMTITPKMTATITDPSTPAAPTLSTSGAGSHTTLPDHGIFNDPTMAGWQDYCLGDMPLQDSPIADFNGSEMFPTNFPNTGQVNVYRVVMEGWTKVHFDAYGETVNSANGKKAFWKSPFSHDGQVPVEEVSFTDVKVIFQED